MRCGDIFSPVNIKTLSRRVWNAFKVTYEFCHDIHWTDILIFENCSDSYESIISVNGKKYIVSSLLLLTIVGIVGNVVMIYLSILTDLASVSQAHVVLSSKYKYTTAWRSDAVHKNYEIISPFLSIPSYTYQSGA